MPITNNKPSNAKVMLPNEQSKVPFSVVESYKNVRTNIISVLSKTRKNVLAIASPNPSEGKSTTSINLAITLAQLNKKVVLIDSDSRRPSIHKKLKLENKLGCADILTNACTIEQSIIHYNDYLDIICCGSRVKNPSELFSSESFDDLIDNLRVSYDYVIIDTPPINPVSETLIIAQKCEALVMVIRLGSTSFEEFEKAYNSCRVLDIDVAGVIMNDSGSGKKFIYKNH